MNSVEAEILKYSAENQLDDLRRVLSQTEDKEINTLIKDKVSSRSFIQTWTILLRGLSESWRKVPIVVRALKHLEESEASTAHMNDVINPLLLELPKYKKGELIELTDFCIESLQSDECRQTSWKDLFPEIISLLSKEDSLFYNGAEISGSEFRSELIKKLYSVPVTAGKVTTLASILTKVKLTKEEHYELINKLCTYLGQLTPQEIPSFVFQILKLCENHNFKEVVIRLQLYFEPRLYQSSKLSSTDSESLGIDDIESASNQDLFEAESTVLYHIRSLASTSSESIREYFNHLKNITKAPEFILHPFQLTVLLVISTLQQYEETVFDILKSCVTRYYTEQQKKESSLWFREMLPKTAELKIIFGYVVQTGLNDRDKVVQGLVNFAFVLLNSKSGLPAIFLNPIVEQEWHLSLFILVKIIKQRRHIGGVVFQEIRNNVLTVQNTSQYIECLYVLSKKLMLMLENQSCVTEMMEDLVQIPGTTALQLLHIIVPLAKISSTIRDHLIVILRKALYSSKNETRQMAVVGFIKLLTNLKISQGVDVSQLSASSFSSGHSVFSQLSLSRSSSQCSQGTFSNEALCLEIIGILRRCFLQKAEIKLQLYNGLFEAVGQNVDIRIAITELLSRHFSKYNAKKDGLLSLDFSKTMASKDVDVVLQEPLGKLVHVLGLLLTKDETDTPVPSLIKLQETLDTLCDQMIECDLSHFELDSISDITDELPDSKRKILVLQEAMNVYEALIAYKIESWTINSVGNGEKISNLYQGYNRLLQLTKTGGKNKKGKKKMDTTEQSSQISSNSTLKKEQKSIILKAPGTVLTFTTVIKALKLFFESNVEWASAHESKSLKNKREIRCYFLDVASQLISRLKGRKTVDNEDNEKTFRSVTEVADILYNKCVKVLDAFSEADSIAAVKASSCFQQILNYMISTHKNNILLFLRKIVHIEKGTIEECLSEVIKVYKKLIESEEELDGDDSETKKLTLILVESLTSITKLIPCKPSGLSIGFYDWLNDFAKNRTFRSRPVAISFLSLLFNTHVKFKRGVEFLRQIVKRLGNVLGVIKEESIIDEELFKIIDDLNVNQAYISVTNAIKQLLDEVDWMIARIKSNNAIAMQVNDSHRKMTLAAKEKEITCQLCFIVGVLVDLTEVAIQPGNLAAALFKNLSQLYVTLTNLTKYFNSKSSKTNIAFRAARFEDLVRIVGRELSPNVNYLILHLEEESKKDDLNQGKKMSKGSIKTKILRDSKMIPKIVYGMEQFSTCILKLTTKTKVDLSRFVGQGSTRDFRIFVQKLPDFQEDNEDEEQEDATDETAVDEIEDEEDAGPAPKKSRKS